MKKRRVLFVCVHNSARSQMAEAFVNSMASEEWEAHSAGLEPGTLNPLVVEAMKEAGIDISQNRTKSVQDFLTRQNIFDYVITVCDETNAQRCPRFPGKVKTIHWRFEDPSRLQGADREKLARIRHIRENMRLKVQEWLKTV
jgi:arsenate reductase